MFYSNNLTFSLETVVAYIKPTCTTRSIWSDIVYSMFNYH